MTRLSVFILLLLLGLSPMTHAAGPGYELQRLADGVYVALAKPGGIATENALFIEGKDFVVATGAHMTEAAIEEFWALVAKTTRKPIRYFILSHHHPGFAHSDGDFPADVTLLMSGETWQSLSKETAKPAAPVLLFNDGMTINCGGASPVVLTNIGKGHTDGDVVVLLPEQEIIYAGGLFYNKSVGYMGNGHMRAWIAALDVLARLEPKIIVPAYGAPGTLREFDEFRTYFRAFLTEILAKIEARVPLETVRKSFTLPEYRNFAGYSQFLRENAAQAYRDLQAEFSDR